MTITRHTATDLFLLLFAAFLCGLLISCVYVVLRYAPSIAWVRKCARFPKYKQFMADMFSQGDSKASIVFTDVILCLLFAIGLLVVSFICNSGNFRISSVVLMSCGCLLGIAVTGKLIRSLLLIISFIIKWILDILLFPIVWLTRKLMGLFSFIHKKALKKRNDRLIAKYTSQRFSQINKTTEFGLIEKYYKELLK